MSENKEKKPRSWQRTTLTVLCVVLVLILVVLLIGMAYVQSRLNLIGRVDPGTSDTMSPEEIASYLATATDATDASDFTGETIDPTDITWDTEPVVPLPGQEGNIVNILLIGQDRRQGEYRARSDAMILCTINKRTKTLTMTSFMRDMYIPIPGYQDNRINVSYAFGGMELLDKCLENSFGVKVDGNVEVDFDGFKEVIELVGGVDITLNAVEVNYLNNQNSEWNLKVGENHLDGSQALAYSRIRMVGNADFERTSRQRTVLTALLNKCKTMPLSKLDSLLVNVLPLLTTDLSNAEIVGYVMELFPMLSQLTLKTQRIPADGTYRGAWIRGMSVLVPDLEANRKILMETLLDPEGQG